MRRVAVLALLVDGLLVGVAVSLGAAPSGAEPPPPCAYSVTPPERALGPAGEVVTVTVTASDCPFPGAPGYGVACVQRQGVDAATLCAQGRGTDVARAEAPYEPGATYVATGRGCAQWAGIAGVAPLCQLLGPLTATP